MNYSKVVNLGIVACPGGEAFCDTIVDYLKRNYTAKHRQKVELIAKAYGIPKDDPGRDAVMESALQVACSVPMDILRACAEAVDLIGEFASKGSRLAVSDAGCGAILCKAAMQAASLNIYINTRSMKDRSSAQALEAEADALLAKYTQKADDLYNAVLTGIRS